MSDAAIDGPEWSSCRELLQLLTNNVLPKAAAALAKAVISNEVRHRLREYGAESQFDELKSITSLLYEYGDEEDETADIVRNTLNMQIEEFYWAMTDINSLEELAGTEKEFVGLLDEHGINSREAKRSFERRREALNEDEDEETPTSSYGPLSASPPNSPTDDAIKSMFHGLRQRR